MLWKAGWYSITELRGCSNMKCIPRVAHRIHMMKARVARMLPFRTDSLSFRPSGEARVLNVEPVDLLLPEQRKCRKSIGNCLLKRWFLRIKHIVPNHEKVSKTLALIQGKSHKHKGRAHRGKKCPGPWSKSNSNGTSPHKILHWWVDSFQDHHWIWRPWGLHFCPPTGCKQAKNL